jgi:hypothetical protein
MKNLAFCTALIMCWTCLTAMPARSESQTSSRRTLAGHTFMPMHSVPAPFIVTTLSSDIGGGKAIGLKNPLIVLDGETVVELDGELLFMELGFNYQQAIREWLAAWVRFGIAARLGANTTSLLAQGAYASSTLEFGWLARLAHGDRWTLAASIELQRLSANIVNIVDWIEAGVGGEGVALVRNSRALQSSLGLRGSWTFNPTFGMVGSVNSGYGESFDLSADNKWFFIAAAGLSVDLKPSRGWPIGMGISGRFSSLPEGGEDIGQKGGSTVVRVGYTGREDFAVGANLGLLWFPQYASDDLIKLSIASIVLDYFF